jgi:hypothetical protein
MSAAVVPFPIARRRSFIRKQTEHMSLMNPEAGVRYFEHQVTVQAEAMRRKGICEELVQRELRAMRRAIQAGFAGNILQPER